MRPKKSTSNRAVQLPGTEPTSAISLLSNPDRVARVVSLPRFTSALPFFYLTKNAKALSRPIRYVDTDERGQEIRWTVEPSRDSGPPGYLAHEFHVRVVQPRIDATRAENGVPNRFVPLGTYSEWLEEMRRGGKEWSRGGRQVKMLMTALEQIAGAKCTARLHLPTPEYDESGQRLYEFVEAKSYSRFNIFAGGTTTLIKELGEDYDDRCSIYIELANFERLMQSRQSRYPLDLDLMFQLDPGSRRVYELIAPYVFGCVQHGQEYFRLDYAWYVQAHHTLQPQTVGSKVVKQMREVTKELRDIGYLDGVDVERVREGGEARFKLVFHVGRYAKHAVLAVSKAMGGQRSASDRIVVRLPDVRGIAERSELSLDEGGERLAAEISARTKDERWAREFVASLAPSEYVAVGRKIRDFDRRLARGEITRNPARYLRKTLEERARRSAGAREPGASAERVDADRMTEPDADKAPCEAVEAVEAASLWESIREDISERIREWKGSQAGAIAISHWIDPLVAVSLADGVLTLRAPNATFATYLNGKDLGPRARESAKAHGVTVRFVAE